jgi:hypothetical protein
VFLEADDEKFAIPGGQNGSRTAHAATSSRQDKQQGRDWDAEHTPPISWIARLRLPGGHAEADDRGDRGERRRLVGPQQDRAGRAHERSGVHHMNGDMTTWPIPVKPVNPQGSPTG